MNVMEKWRQNKAKRKKEKEGENGTERNGYSHNRREKNAEYMHWILKYIIMYT